MICSFEIRTVYISAADLLYSKTIPGIIRPNPCGEGASRTAHMGENSASGQCSAKMTPTKCDTRLAPGPPKLKS